MFVTRNLSLVVYSNFHFELDVNFSAELKLST